LIRNRRASAPKSWPLMHQRLGILAFPILAFAAACGPPPVGPRPALDPPPDPAPVDPAADADV